MADLLLRGGRVLQDGDWVGGDLRCRAGLVVELAQPGSTPTDGDQVVDVSGRLLAPGFVDLQCNGAVGIDLAAEPERLWELGAELPRWGVTSWLPTIVTTPDGIVDRALDALATGPPAAWVGARPLGLHLEGPFLHPLARGAHAERLLRTPSGAAIDGWSRAAGVAVVTMAPDLPGALDALVGLVERGVTVSLGHSPATAEQAAAAVDAGARSVTHLFNAMAALHHRAPGLAGVALTDDRLHVGLIADGVHVHPMSVALAQRALGDRLVLVTDAVAPLGLPVGTHTWEDRSITVDEVSVRLADGTLAGSVLSMDAAVRNLAAFTGCSPAEAVAAASTAPARLLRDSTIGHLRPGARADIAVLDADLNVVATFIGGHVAPTGGAQEG